MASGFLLPVSLGYKGVKKTLRLKIWHPKIPIS